ncbi:hypothetical protein CBA19CS22_39535 [Caballeronia novacaledonica]|uniref:Uncharacterized protein n=1 Tax=Caballeronia novacaledonica TaxID=1544861 RepID=A0ACB5R6E0_9BURK|nr:hypothetical protein CBA19CS22_39535 [Caballeronia novacaledonica]
MKGKTSLAAALLIVLAPSLAAATGNNVCGKVWVPSRHHWEARCLSNPPNDGTFIAGPTSPQDLRSTPPPSGMSAQTPAPARGGLPPSGKGSAHGAVSTANPANQGVPPSPTPQQTTQQQQQQQQQNTQAITNAINGIKGLFHK